MQNRVVGWLKICRVDKKRNSNPYLQKQSELWFECVWVCVGVTCVCCVSAVGLFQLEL